MAENDTAARGQTSETRGQEEGAKPPAYMGGEYHPRSRLSDKKRLQQRHTQKRKGAAAKGVAV